MYWQKRFDRENPNKELEDKILEIHSDNKDFGYRRIHAMLRKQGYVVNKKRVQRIMQKLGIQVTSFTQKAVNTILIRVKLEKSLLIELIDDLTLIYHIRKLQLILPN